MVSQSQYQTQSSPLKVIEGRRPVKKCFEVTSVRLLELCCPPAQSWPLSLLWTSAGDKCQTAGVWGSGTVQTPDPSSAPAACTYTWTCACILAYTYTCMHTYTSSCTCNLKLTCICTCTCTCFCTCICTYTCTWYCNCTCTSNCTGRDLDCLDSALCCFNGCANKCQGRGPVEGNGLVPQVLGT